MDMIVFYAIFKKFTIAMEHYSLLKSIYQKAPIHKFYEGISLSIESKSSTVTLNVDERYFHAGMTGHGSVYFKMLDDAAYFAAQSVEQRFFLTTSGFQVQLMRPMSKGEYRAVGTCLQATKNTYICRSELFDKKGRLIAIGQGEFHKTKVALEDL